MRYLMFAAASLLYAATAFAADGPFVTARGFTFSRIESQFPKFKGAVRAPDGQIWSGCLGRYPNVGVSIAVPPSDSARVEGTTTGIVTESEATKACAAAGGILPLVGDFQALDSFFQGPGPRYERTAQDVADYLALFPDCTYMGADQTVRTDVWYWTREIADPYPRTVKDFDPYGDIGNAEHLLGVRCLGSADVGASRN